MESNVKYLIMLFAFVLLSCSDTEIVREYYDNGRLKKETTIKDGKNDGLLREYYPSGKLKVESNWKNGKQEGLQVTYLEDSHVYARSVYRNSQKLEAVIYWPSSSVAQERQHYIGSRLACVSDYNSAGIKENDILIPIFEADRDTVELGEFYQVDFRILYPTLGRWKVYTGKYNYSTLELEDQVEILPRSDGYFHYEEKAERQGSNVIPFLFRYIPANGDTIVLDKMNTKHVYFVETLSN